MYTPKLNDLCAHATSQPLHQNVETSTHLSPKTPVYKTFIGFEFDFSDLRPFACLSSLPCRVS